MLQLEVPFNQGLISADIAGQSLTINASSVINNGILQAINGATLAIASPVAGSGTITTDSGFGSLVTQNSDTVSGNVISGALTLGGIFDTSYLVLLCLS